MSISSDFLLFLIFHFSATGQWIMTKIGRNEDPYLEGSEAKFQCDLLRWRVLLRGAVWIFPIRSTAPCGLTFGSAPNFWLGLFTGRWYLCCYAGWRCGLVLWRPFSSLRPARCWLSMFHTKCCTSRRCSMSCTTSTIAAVGHPTSRNSLPRRLLARLYSLGLYGYDIYWCHLYQTCSGYWLECDNTMILN